MAKITPVSYIAGISGKVCKHDADEYRTNSSSGKIILSKKCNPYTGPASAKQLAQQSKFKERVGVIQQWLRDNRPSTSNPQGTALYREAQRLKVAMKLDNTQAVLAKFQKNVAPWTITLPSQGSNQNGGTQTPSGDGGQIVNPPSGSGGQDGDESYG